MGLSFFLLFSGTRFGLGLKAHQRENRRTPEKKKKKKHGTPMSKETHGLPSAVQSARLVAPGSASSCHTCRRSGRVWPSPFGFAKPSNNLPEIPPHLPRALSSDNHLCWARTKSPLLPYVRCLVFPGGFFCLETCGFCSFMGVPRVSGGTKHTHSSLGVSEKEKRKRNTHKIAVSQPTPFFLPPPPK